MSEKPSKLTDEQCDKYKELQDEYTKVRDLSLESVNILSKNGLNDSDMVVSLAEVADKADENGQMVKEVMMKGGCKKNK